MAWFEFHTNLPEHQKTMLLEDILSLSKVEVIGHLCLIWAWAMDNAVDGDISRLSSRRLAMIAGYNVRKARDFLEALIEAGFIDREGESLRLHDWDDYAGRYQYLKQRNAERKREYRKRKSEHGKDEKAEFSEVFCEDVPGTSHGRPADVPGQQDRTVQDSTEQDSTEQDSTEQEIKNNKSLCGDDADSAPPACETLRDYFSSRYLCSEDLLGAGPESIAEGEELCLEVYRRLVGRPPTEFDRARFFSIVFRDGEIKKDSLELLCYAFEAAATAGERGKWSYIEGVLERLGRRGIRNLRDAENYEFERLEGR